MRSAPAPVNDRFDEPAKRASVQVVQMAGWEAMPADRTTLIACRRAAGDGAGPDGAGAAEPTRQVTVSVTFTRRLEGGVPFKQKVFARMLSSIIAMLDDPNASLVGHADALLPNGIGKAIASDRLHFRMAMSMAACWAPFRPSPY